MGRLTDHAKEVLYNLFCIALLVILAYLAYRYIYCDYMANIEPKLKGK